MKLRFLATILLSSLISVGLSADEPEEEINLKGATSKILPLNAKILPLEVRVDDLSGRTEDLSAKIKKLEADSTTLAVKETDTEIRIELSGDILFDFDRDNIQPAAEPTLRNVAEMILTFPSGGARVEGHTDSKGGDDYNLSLSKRRAESVKHWFVANSGIEARKLSTEGFGETKPSVPNTKTNGVDDPEGRRKNRRVEVVVMKQVTQSFDGGPDRLSMSSVATRTSQPTIQKDYEVLVKTPLRRAPDKSAEILTELKPSTRLNVVGQTGDFLEVRSAKKDRPPGFVAMRDVKLVE